MTGVHFSPVNKSHSHGVTESSTPSLVRDFEDPDEIMFTSNEDLEMTWTPDTADFTDVDEVKV